MPDTYSVRLEDGSEIGPLDLPAVREWYARGLIHADSPVLSPGAQRWVALRQVHGLASLGGGVPRPARVGTVRATPRPVQRPLPRATAATARSASAGTRGRVLVALSVAAVLAGAGLTLAWRARGPATVSATAATPPEEALAAATRFGAQRRAQAVRLALAAVPHLTPLSAETLMSRSQAEVLSPEETFRRSQAALRRGLSALSAAETRELGRLTDALHARLASRDRRRLAEYLARVKDSRETSPDDDRALSSVVRAAELKLPAAHLERLRMLYEKATLAAR